MRKDPRQALASCKDSFHIVSTVYNSPLNPYNPFLPPNLPSNSSSTGTAATGEKLPDGCMETVLGKLPTNWKIVSASDYCSKVADGTHDSPKQSEEGYYLVTSKHIKNGKVDTSSAYRITAKDYEEVNKRSKVNKWDVLFSMIGTVGEVCLIDSEPDFAIKNVGLFKCNEEVNAKWLFYFFNSKQGKNHLMSRLSGTTQSYVTLGTLREFPIPKPPRVLQERAIDILSCLDDKIDLLRKQNKTLEATAQTLFKRWFVEFNFPNEKGKPYKESGGKMVESELGEVPEGWEVGEIKDICEIKNGFAFKSKDYVENGISVVRTTNFKNGSIDLNDVVYLTKEKSEESPSYFLERFDFLLVMVGASIGKNVIVPSKILPALQNQNMWNFKPKKEKFRLYNIFLLKKLISEQSRSASGSARDFFRKDYFYSLDVIIPSEKNLLNFARLASPIFEKIDTNHSQIQALTQLRNMLLPKLVLGKIAPLQPIQ